MYIPMVEMKSILDLLINVVMHSNIVSYSESCERGLIDSNMRSLIDGLNFIHATMYLNVFGIFLWSSRSNLIRSIFVGSLRATRILSKKCLNCPFVITAMFVIAINVELAFTGSPSQLIGYSWCSDEWMCSLHFVSIEAFKLLISPKT